MVTLLLDDAAQQRFDRLRAAHFPVERNRLAAHVTLFHALPGEHLAEVRDQLRTAAARPPFGVAVTGVRFLGRGVAIDLDAAELTALRRSLAAAFDPWLTRQDRQWSRPHVTVQNKVTPETARALHADLAAAFRPETVPARGIGLWHYRGGPWDPDSEFDFAEGPRPSHPSQARDEPPDGAEGKSMEVDMIVEVIGGADEVPDVRVVDVEDLTRLHLAVGALTDEEVDAALRSAGLGRLLDADNGVLDVAALRAAAEPQATGDDWAGRFDAMVAAAEQHGWTADDGAGLQVHVEPAASA